MAIHITTPAELQDINLDLTEDYILDNDLDMTAVVWTRIGGGANDFEGTFDGQGFTISNLTANSGLFGDVYTAGTIIQNVNLDNFILSLPDASGALANYTDSITIANIHATNLAITLAGTTPSNIGGLIGQCYTVTISDCSAQGTITSTVNTSIATIGGLIAYVDSTTNISDCSSDVNINLSQTVVNDAVFITQVGGLLGSTNGSSVIADSFSTGDITISTVVTRITDVGGLIGVCNSGTSAISGCYSTGNISLSITSADSVSRMGGGGFIGSVYDASTLDTCYSTGNISCISDASEVAGVGGFVSGVQTGATITNCYSRGDVEYQSDGSLNIAGITKGAGVGGFVGQFFDATIQNCYSSGNVTSTLNSYVGGFAGQVADIIELTNCFSVGTVTADGNMVGGFLGSLAFDTTVDYTDYNIVNCAWYTGACDFAIGISYPTWSNAITYPNNALVLYDTGLATKIYRSIQISNLNNIPDSSPLYWTEVGEQEKENLATESYGTDELDNTEFYTTDHVVYDQGNPDAWDFSTPIWYERTFCSDYPTFEPCEEEETPATIEILCGVVGVVTATINNLDHLEGQEVAILADGEVLPRQVVLNGQIILEDSYMKVHVGLPYESDFETLNVEIPTRDGTIQGKKVKIGNVMFRVIDSRGGWIGPNEDVLYEAFNDAIIEKLGGENLGLMYTGDLRMPLGGGYEDGGRIFYRQVDPLPITISCVVPEVNPGGASG